MSAVPPSAHTVTRSCKACLSVGKYYAPHCRACDADIDETWLENDRKRMPCGHYDNYLEYERPCDVCDGKGETLVLLTPNEHRRHQLGQGARTAYVTIAIFALIILIMCLFLGYFG